MMSSCIYCGSEIPKTATVSAGSIDRKLFDFIRSEKADWNEDSQICLQHLGETKLRYLTSMIQTGNQMDKELMEEVLASYTYNQLLVKTPSAPQEAISFGDRVADRIAEFGGSWSFIISFFGVMMAWIALNTVQLFQKPFDPYPFILLNLCLSCLASVQAPVIMMSQNRKELRDELRAEEDFKINLKSEIELRLLHDKVDHLVYHLLPQYMEGQQELFRLIQEIKDQKKNS